jgi:transposase
MKRYATRVGIDLARRSNHKAVIVCDDGAGAGTRRKTFSFSHDLEGFEALCARIIQQTGKPSLEGVTVNMEPTSGVWECVACFLKNRGAEACFTRPDVVSQLRKVHSRFAKTDRIDADTLTRIPVSFPDRLIPVVNVAPRIRALRTLSGQRQRLVEDVVRWKSRFMAKTEAVWTPLLVHLDNEVRFCVLVRAFFKKFCDPRKVVRYGQERFEKWCRKTAHGNTSPDLFDTLWQGSAKAAALWEEMERSGAMTVDWELFGDVLAQDLRLIESLEAEVERLDAQIKNARTQVPECDLLEQLPGVGKVISVTLAGILMPVARFANTKKCGAYTGFTSRHKASAGREIEGLKITKSGNRRLKRDLALAADTAMINDPELADFAIRLLSAGKHYNKVRVAVGRKIAVRAYSLLKRIAAGEAEVAYIWRDLRGRTITKQQAKLITNELWAMYKARQQ